MSRSALLRSERFMAAKQRQLAVEQQQQMLQQEEEDEASGRPMPIQRDLVPMVPHADYHLHPLLIKAIRSAPFTQTRASKLNTFNEVVDEIYNQVEHVEPFNPMVSGMISRTASIAFCLLFKMFQMKLTRKQMKVILSHPDSPYIRALGVLYLRYTLPAEQLWDWLGPVFENDFEHFTPSSSSSSNVVTNTNEFNMTISAWTQKLLLDNRYYGTILPRIPVLVERQLKQKLMGGGGNSSATTTTTQVRESSPSLSQGQLIRAIYSEDGLWYDARIEEPGDDPDTYWVTFLPEDEYGNQEQVHISNIDLKTAPSSGDDDGRRHITSETVKEDHHNSSRKMARYADDVL